MPRLQRDQNKQLNPATFEPEPEDDEIDQLIAYYSELKKIETINFDINKTALRNRGRWVEAGYGSDSDKEEAERLRAALGRGEIIIKSCKEKLARLKELAHKRDARKQEDEKIHAPGDDEEQSKIP